MLYQSDNVTSESGAENWIKIEWELALPESGDIPVWVSVTKLEHEWRRSVTEYIGAGGDNGMPGKYDHFAEWIMSAKYVEMPEVCLVDGFVRFNNGRHRFAWLRDHGMTALQVATQPGDVKSIKMKFGTQDEVSQWIKT